MKKLILILSFVICHLSFSFAQQNETAQDLDSLYAQEMLGIGIEAPDFIIDSLSNTSLKDMRGRYVVLHFWASWCPDCRKDMPLMNEIYDEHASDSVIFIHISFDTDAEVWQKYVKENNMGGLQLSELKKMKESATAQAYHLKWIPSIYVLNTEGKVILKTVVAEKLRERLRHLDFSKVRIPRTRVSRMPQYPGGDTALRYFLARNVNYPRTANNYGLEGQTIVEFMVGVDGTISDISVKDNQITVDDKLPFRKLAGDEKKVVRQKVLDMFAEEAKRVVGLMPKWKPGVRFGIPFKVKYQMPINYKIHYNNED